MWLKLGIIISFACGIQSFSGQDKLYAIISFVSLNRMSSVVAFVCQQKGKKSL